MAKAQVACNKAIASNKVVTAKTVKACNTANGSLVTACAHGPSVNQASLPSNNVALLRIGFMPRFYVAGTTENPKPTSIFDGRELDVPTEQAVSTCWRWQLATWTKQRCPSGSPCGLTGNADGQRSADRSRISRRACRLRNCSRRAAICSENSSRRPAALAARRAFLSSVADRV